ncbi:biotin-dependent carboxyltransferase family protein [Paenibacillus sp. PL2-23]|uniref:5-oxoprolinase subunit C family protein n=1 Tax=Paenibacillus sp. PL2-23 TaxID=2100729 RepID=UPI0030F72B4C
MSIVIEKPGLLATLQDLGRYGYQKQGVVVGGAMDTAAARIANWLVGNDESEAVLELTLAGAELRIVKECWIAVCGGDMSPVTKRGEKVPQWRPVKAAAGAVIRFAGCRSGCRTYVALAGGLDAPLTLGSRSTYLRGGIGGLEGRALRAGDALTPRNEAAELRLDERTLAESEELRWPRWHAGGFAVAHMDIAEIRLMSGMHTDWLHEEARMRLEQEIFAVGRNSDRMGYRLDAGEGLSMTGDRPELLSEPVAMGTIQLPPDGSPIILMADRQTTGGYPRIGHVATVDLPVLAQLKPGDRLRLQRVSHAAAETLLLEDELEMLQLKGAIGLKLAGAVT